MKQSLPLIAVALAITLMSCSAPNKYAENYTRSTTLPKLKRIPVSNVLIEEFSDESALNSRMTDLRSQGYVMVGHSLFNAEYIPPLFAKRFGANEGCERVLLIRRKNGQGVGTRMEAATYSPPSMGFVNTTLYTPSGQSYSAVSSVLNPAQRTYAARDYVYDSYRHGAAFFTIQKLSPTTTDQ